MKRTLAERVTEAFDTKDGRTIAEMMADDTFAEVKVEKVEKSGDGFWLQWDGGTTSHFKFPDGTVPKKGDTLHIYPGEYFRRHGFALNGVMIEWKTPKERVAEDLASSAKRDREQREEFEARRGDLLRQKDGLPEPLRRRIERFESESPTFWIESGWYELFCCTEAAKFADRAREAVEKGADTEEVDRFWGMPSGDGEGKREDCAIYREEPEMPEVRWLLWAWALNSRTYGYNHKRQKKVLGCGDGHSGNTFGGAMQLAAGLLQGLVEAPDAA